MSVEVEVIDIVIIILLVLIIFSHSIGCYLLVCIYCNGEGSIQEILLVNLSVVACSSGVVSLVAHLIRFSYSLEGVKLYVHVIHYTVFVFVYYLNLFYITIDKLVYIVINIKYPVYWNMHKTKYLLATTWSVGAIMALYFCVATCIAGNGLLYLDYLFYFYLSLDFLFIIVTGVSYSFIFHTFKKTRCMPTYCNASINLTKPPQSTFEIFRNSRFYVSGLLILNFLVFVVITDLLYLFCVVIGGNMSHLILYTIWMLNNLSYLCDAVIYIFLQPLVRKMLWRKLYRLFPRAIRRIPSTQSVDMKRKISFYMFFDK